MMGMTMYPDHRSNENRNILWEMFQEIDQYEKWLEKARTAHQWSEPWDDEEFMVSEGKLISYRIRELEPKKGGIEGTRGRRIRDKQRMKAKARRVFADVASSFPAGERQAYLKANERLADNLAHCRKRCCNKQRLWEGPPMQEVRAAMAADPEEGLWEWEMFGADPDAKAPPSAK